LRDHLGDPLACHLVFSPLGRAHPVLREACKLTSSRIHSALPDLFPWLARLHDAGVPVTRIRRTRDGRWFTAPLPQSGLRRGYLMERVSGSVANRWSDCRARAGAPALATVKDTRSPSVAGRPLANSSGVRYGDVKCGVGYCAIDDEGQIHCSRTRGGSAATDSYGNVK
jgi:hypothetical protein